MAKKLSKKAYMEKTGETPGEAWAKADVCPKNAFEAQRMFRQLDQSGSYIQSGKNTRQLSDKTKNSYIIILYISEFSHEN